MLKKSTFKGGIHPGEHISLTENIPIKEFPLPEKVTIPLQQHIGAPCKTLVKKGDTVLVGQKIGDSDAFISAPVHSSVSGIVLAVELSPHPIFGKGEAVVIKTDGKQELDPSISKREIDSLSKEDIISIIRDKGIVGMGGATFPTHVKMSPPEGSTVDTLVVNGCECELYLTSDHRLMIEYTEKMIEGLNIVKDLLGAKRIVIGIEDNKMDALEKIDQLTKNDSNFDVLPLKVKYPQGAEKMLIDAACGRKVPPGKLPLEVNVVVINVSTAVAIYDAVVEDMPLVKRVVTVSGDGILNPGNYLIPTGVKFIDVIEHCGGFKDSSVKVILGGPMMGFAQGDLNVPVIKGASGILCFSDIKKSHYDYQACIKCGRCVDVCPMNLMPSLLSRLIERNSVDKAGSNNLMDCMECGCCVYVCPARRPIVQWIKSAKAEVRKKSRR